MKGIQLYGIFDSYFSLGEVSRGIASQLVHDFPNCSLCGILSQHEYWDTVLQRDSGGNRPFGVAGEELLRFADRNSSAEIGIYIGPLPIPMAVFDKHKVKIAFLVCESRIVDVTIVKECNQLDLICAPSEFCRSAFLRSGLTVPIRKVHHGLAKLYRPSSNSIGGEQPFTFFNTFGCFAPPERKGMRELLDCYTSAFSGDADTTLLIRTHPTIEATREVDNAASLANVRLEPLFYEAMERYAARYSEVHCVVCPSKVEGFGLVPFHALACETPVIAPLHSGLVEFLSTDNALVVDSRETTSRDATYCYHVDNESLIEQMVRMRRDWKDYKHRSCALGPHFRTRFSWDNVMCSFKSLLRDLTEGLPITQSLSHWVN